MNIIRSVNSPSQASEHLLEEAMAVVAESTGVSLRRAGRGGKRLRARGKGGEGHGEYVPVLRPVVDRAATLRQLELVTAAEAVPSLLVTQRLSPELAEVCRELGLCFVDLAGNAFLQAPGLYVYVTGRKLETGAFTPKAEAGRVFGSAGLRILHACLSTEGLLQAPLRAIAAASGTAVGTVSGILRALQASGYLMEAEGGATRRWVAKERLIEGWALNYGSHLRSKLPRRKLKSRDAKWWERVEPWSYHMQWGGEVAAFLWDEVLVPGVVTLYTHGDPGALIRDHRLVADPAGDVELLEAFWTEPEEPGLIQACASPLVVYADLLEHGDPRVLDSARRVHERFLR